ncbi:retrovirus-related pol polyprotein from transposon TNT 1-94, partial [Tanacetum coccineum]
LAVARKARPKMIETSSSLSIFKITNSTGKMNLPTFTNRFSQTPMGYLIDRSAAEYSFGHDVLYCQGSDETWQCEATWVSFLLGQTPLNNSRTLLTKLKEVVHPRHPFFASLIWMEKVDWMFWKAVASRGGVGKGGSYVLIPDMVVMVKVGALDFGVSLLLIVESIWEYCSRSSSRYGYIKNHMKTVKNKQSRTRERKSAQQPEAKPRKSQTLSNSQVKDNKIDLLVQQYEQFIILEEESINSDFARFNTIITSLKALDEGFSSKNYVRKFLRALHPKWREKVTAIEESKDLSSLALDELIGNLKVHELVKKKDSKFYKSKKERVKSIALKAKKESSDDETLTSESDDEEYVMASDWKCFRCGDLNHLIGDCPKPPRNKDQKAFVGGCWSDSENEAEDKTNDETCLMAQSSNEVCLRTCLEPDEWIKDSGCSKHMTGNKSLFSTYNAYDEGNVVFGSNIKGKIIGKCTISNDSLTISNVEHVDNLAFNLLSVSRICDNKCKVLFTEDGSEIIKDYKVIGNGIRKNGLYVMKLGNKSQDKLCLATVVDNFNLWHRRLSHVNMCLIQSLSSKEFVRNLPKLKYDKHFCDACKFGKQAHASHKAKNMVSTNRCLELLHMNLFGPSAIKSYGGNLYTLVIVDDYSRYTWTKNLKTKSKAFEKFEILIKKIQNQLGCSIVAIRTDHGREFDNEVQFRAFCDAQGITHNFSAPRTPQSNRVVERKNRTLQEMSKTMLNEQSIPQKFWCNAVDTSTYILNRILI